MASRPIRWTGWALAPLLLALRAAPLQADAVADSAGLPMAPTDSVGAASATPTIEGGDSPEVPPTSDSTTVRASAPTALRARPAVVRMVRVRSGSHNVVRAGPGERFAIVGLYPAGAVFPVVGKDGPWIDVRLSDTETGWIHESLCREFDDLSDLEFRPNPKLFTRTGSYILTGYTGAYAYDRKSNSLVLGGRLGYYVFDRLQCEAGVAWTHVRRPAEIVESLFDLTLEAEDFDMMFYHLLVTWELLPGRQMVPFVSGGLGSSMMLGTSEPSFNLGAGTTLFLSKRTAMRWEFRTYHFHSGSEGARMANTNVEFILGTAVLF